VGRGKKKSSGIIDDEGPKIRRKESASKKSRKIRITSEERCRREREGLALLTGPVAGGSQDVGGKFEKKTVHGKKASPLKGKKVQGSGARCSPGSNSSKGKKSQGGFRNQGKNRR